MDLFVVDIHEILCQKIIFQSTLTVVFNIKQDIIKSLSLYYYTFVDLLDFKDHVSELFTTMDACQLQLDIVSTKCFVKSGCNILPRL